MKAPKRFTGDPVISWTNWNINHGKKGLFSYQDYIDPNPKPTNNPNPKLNPIKITLTLTIFP